MIFILDSDKNDCELFEIRLKELGHNLQILSNVDDFRGIFGTYNFVDDNNNVNSTLNILQFDGFYFDEYIDQNQSFEY